jgi:hypothetical protein
MIVSFRPVVVSTQAQNLCHAGVPEVLALLQPEKINATVQIDHPILYIPNPAPATRS